MPNVNINRTTTDTQDNVRYTTPQNKIDFRGITLLVISIFSAITAVWMIALGFANVGCMLTSTYPCKEATYIFWGYIIIVTIALVIALFYTIPAISIAIENMKYKYWRGVITHRDDIKKYATSIIAVAQESAHSEATAGMDNYSPSISKSLTSAQEPVTQVSTSVPIKFFDLDEE